VTTGKTIKQLAEELGVSKQAIHQKIKKEPLSTDLRKFTTTVDGTVYISIDGENLIKSAFVQKCSQPVDDKQPSTVDGLVDGKIIAVLQDTISELHKQLAIKDKQIDELNSRLSEVTNALTAQQALNAGTLQQLMLVDNKKHYWWQFWKNKNN
jgi:plasmid maintenance system antidote protein VapI